MFNVIPFRAARNLMNTSMDDMLSDRFFRHFFDMSDMVGTAGFRVDVKEQPLSLIHISEPTRPY